MTEIHKIAGLKLSKSGYSVLVNTAKIWFNKYLEFNVHSVKNTEDKKRCTSLVTDLSTIFRDYFADTDPKIIQKTYYKAIQQALSNKRRNKKLKEKKTRMGTHQQESQSQSTAVSSKVDNNSSISSNDNNMIQALGSKFKIKNGNGFSSVDTKARTNFAKKLSNANFVLFTTVKGHDELESETIISNLMSAQAVGNVTQLVILKLWRAMFDKNIRNLDH